MVLLWSSFVASSISVVRAVADLVATILTLVIQVWGMNLFARLVFVPYHVLVPGILVLSALGALVLNNRVFDVGVLLGFGILGYLMVKHGFPLASFVLGFLLGPLAEINLRRALQTDPDLVQFAVRPRADGRRLHRWAPRGAA